MSNPLPPEQPATDTVPRLRGIPSPVDLVGVGINSLDTMLHIPHFPEFNSKLQVRSSQICPGGQVATAAVACQRWGLRTRYVGKIGDDPAGQMQRDEFAREGVEAHLIDVPQCASQQAFILVDRSTGERTILWQRDPRLDLQPEEIFKDWITTARLLHVDGHPAAPAAQAAMWAREAGIMVAADLDNLYTGVEVLLEYVDYVIGSREFPERLTGIADVPDALREIQRRFGCRVAGATLGCDGALLWEGTNFHYSPAFQVDAVDTTGAGDIFHAGFNYGLLRGWSIDESLEFGCAAAALNCTASGARGGIKTIEEIQNLIRSGSRYPTAFRNGRIDKSSATNLPATSKR